MKPRRFYDTMMPIFLIFEIFGLCCCILIILTAIAIPCLAPEGMTPKLWLYIIALLAMCGGGFYGVFDQAFYNRAFGRLLVYEDKVVYKCFLRKTVTMKIEEIKYAGVEDFHLLNGGLLKFRGDEDAFVYLSASPYPEKYHGKVTLLNNKKGFIKFTYSDKLAETLIGFLPNDTHSLIRAFYGKMKSQDMLNNRKSKNRRKK